MNRKSDIKATWSDGNTILGKAVCACNSSRLGNGTTWKLNKNCNEQTTGDQIIPNHQRL